MTQNKRPRYVVNVRPAMMARWVEVAATDDRERAIALAQASYDAGNYDALVWDRKYNAWLDDTRN